MGVSINAGIPKWLVYKFIMENSIKMNVLGVPLFQEPPPYLRCLMSLSDAPEFLERDLST